MQKIYLSHGSYESPHIIYKKAKQISTSYQGRQYIKLGKSYHTLSIGNLFIRLLKMTGLGVLTILTVFTPLCAASFRKYAQILVKEIRTKKEKTIYYLLDTHATAIKSANYMFSKMQNKSSFIINHHSANCYLKMEMEKGTIKKEFIIKNRNNSLLSNSEVLQSIDKINQNLCHAISFPDLGDCKKAEWLILCKNNNSYSEIHFNMEEKNREGVKMEGEGTSLGLAALNLTVEVINQMGFPKKDTFVKNGEFVPGPLTQTIVI